MSRDVVVFICGFLFLTVFIPNIHALNVTVEGEWAVTVDPQDGEESYESEVDQLEIEIHRPGPPIGNWRMDVARDDIDWSVDFVLEIRRTSDGRGPGDIDGGEDYQEITLSASEFFTGDRWRRGVEAQFRLSADFTGIQSGTYVTDVVFTATEL